MSHVVAPGGMELDPDKVVCVEHMRDRSVTVVTAGAGAGKTYTVLACLLDVVEYHGGSLDQCALITFTNQGADELRKRVEKKVAELARGADGERWRQQQERLGSAFIGTIHGFCASLLKTYGFAERVPRSASTTMSSFRQRQALADVVEEALTAQNAPRGTEGLRDLDLAEHEVRGILGELAGFCRSRGVDLDQLALLTATELQPDGEPDGGRDVRAAITEALLLADREYTTRKRDDGLVDVNDLLLATARMLCNERHGADLSERIAQRYPYLFVDEFQDTNPVQEIIIDVLQPNLERLVVVGDVKQAIFRFLAATPYLLQQVAGKYGVEPCALTYAQRPTHELLRAQRVLFDSIRSSGYEIVEQLEGREGMREREWNLPPLRFWPAARHEDPHVVQDAVLSLVDDHGVPPSDIAVVAATNRELLEVELSLRGPLKQRGIGVERSGGGLFGTPEIVATYQMLRVIADADDDASLFEALHTPYLSDVDIDAAIAHRLERGPDSPSISTSFASTSAGAAIAALRAAARKETVPQLLTRLFDAFDIVAKYESIRGLQEAANLLRLREYAREVMSNEQALTLGAFIDHLRLAIALGFDEAEAPVDVESGPSNRVRLITMHGAKGLEWPVVIVPGMGRVLNARWKDPRFILAESSPTDRSQAVLDVDLYRRDGTSIASPRWQDRLARVRDEDLDEQFRLFYVAVTRAKEAVVLIGGSGERATGRSVTWGDEVVRARAALEAAGAVFDY